MFVCACLFVLGISALQTFSSVLAMEGQRKESILHSFAFDGAPFTNQAGYRQKESCDKLKMARQSVSLW